MNVGETIHQPTPPLFPAKGSKQPARAPYDPPFESRAADTPAEAEEAEEAEERRTGTSMDEEIKTMSAILRMLGKMPNRARGRVVAWLADRFQESQLP